MILDLKTLEKELYSLMGISVRKYAITKDGKLCNLAVGGMLLNVLITNEDGRVKVDPSSSYELNRISIDGVAEEHFQVTSIYKKEDAIKVAYHLRNSVHNKGSIISFVEIDSDRNIIE